ncbi:hypothetical protein TRFO_31923 [Tritrichomonas foetus]|uniref:Uncharacterized protein n=1 Tax=Tritrichomonas foetus TaxID=1144522 RepID=A0A1J4JVJ6_9EUKA|nr:hypothetical protein TRFO_31923 [Tritrichomonas foetus]|eukprot:OHT01293.1 hypothetical protein TRFO_31923 [Tritrichomonas foetus]
MIFLFFLFTNSVKHNEHLYASFVRPPKNPLEIYPFSFLPLCISEPVPGFLPESSRKCKKPIVDVPSNHFIPPQTWCTTELNPESRNFLNFLLSNQYQLLFNSGGQSASCFLGPNEYSIFTHFNFVFLKTLNEFSLAKIIPSNLINISEQFLGFTYETSFISTPRVAHEHPIINSFIIGAFCVAVILFIALLIPAHGKHTYIIVTRMPSHTFPLVVMCGSGSGILGLSLTLRACFKVINGQDFSKYEFIIPLIISAFTTSVVTSMLCAIWRLKDVASALYFAPLLFPSICVALLFTVQWISVSVESCISIPLNYIFYFIVTVVFVMIPTNLIGSLITAAIFRPRFHSTQKVKIAVRRFSRSRRHFMTTANSLIFFLTFPIYQLVTDNVEYGKIPLSNLTTYLFIITYILSAVVVGISTISIKCEKEGDWAWFSFLSSAGASVSIWIISNFWSVFVLGQTSTLQVTLYPTFTALICIGLALLSGSISVLTSQVWIVLKGIPMKKP